MSATPAPPQHLPAANLSIKQLFLEDLDTALQRDPAARNRLEVAVSYPGVHALWAHRMASRLWRNGFPIVARLIQQATRTFTGVDIHPAARIGRRLFIDHATGVVIGETAVIGEDCLIFHGVTLGGQRMVPAEKYLQDHPDAVYASQFANPANPQIHYRTTGPEIWEQAEGNVDVFVVGVGSAGTIAGAGKYLKEQNPGLEIIAVEPTESPLLSTGTPGAHKIQGIGANFVPENYDPQIVNRILRVDSDVAVETARRSATSEGLLVGISSGANLAAAVELSKDTSYLGKTIVTVLPDTGERYLSTVLFEGITEE